MSDEKINFNNRKLLASLGIAEAQYSLGLIYSKGKEIPQDYVEAVKWYRLAAEQGLAQAQHNLGVMHGKGQGIPKNYQ